MSRWLALNIHTGKLFREVAKWFRVIVVAHLVFRKNQVGDNDFIGGSLNNHYRCIQKLRNKGDHMSHILAIITAATLLLALNSAQAQVQFGGLSYRGSGCPVGSVAISPSPDNTSVSILFDSFQLQVPRNLPNTGRVNRANDPALNFKSCALSLTADLPEGQQVESLEISLFNRGAMILDGGVQGTFSTMFMGHQGLGGVGSNKAVLENRTWNGETNDDWVSSPVVTVPIRSACASSAARSVKFMLNNHVELAILNRDLSRSGLATVDSSDINGSVKIRLITRPCGASGPANGGRTTPVRPGRVRP